MMQEKIFEQGRVGAESVGLQGKVQNDMTVKYCPPRYTRKKDMARLPEVAGPN